MASVVMVEWLARGGIAQTTETWRRVARAHGHQVVVVGRAGGHLGPDVAIRRRIPTRVGAVDIHRRLAHRAAAFIMETRPDVVYVQNYWLPLMELPVLRAAREAGCLVILAVHNHQPHERRAGLSVGMGRLLALTDIVVAHSTFVARSLHRPGARIVEVPLPSPLDLLESDPTPIAGLEPNGRTRIVSFGVLRRSYKGSDIIIELGRRAGDVVDLVVAGVGAPPTEPGLRSVDGFLSPGELKWLLLRADAAFLPYTSASQSAAVVLAQALGAAPVTSAVGGIPEQVEHGVTGMLMRPGATVDEWWAAVDRVRDGSWEAIREGARREAEVRHQDACRRWLELITSAGS